MFTTKNHHGTSECDTPDLAGNVLCLSFFWPVKSKTGHDMSQTCLQVSRDISFLGGEIHKLWKKDGAIFCSLDPKKEPSSHAASILRKYVGFSLYSGTYTTVYIQMSRCRAKPRCRAKSSGVAKTGET